MNAFNVFRLDGLNPFFASRTRKISITYWTCIPMAVFFSRLDALDFSQKVIRFEFAEPGTMLSRI